MQSLGSVQVQLRLMGMSLVFRPDDSAALQITKVSTIDWGKWIHPVGFLSTTVKATNVKLRVGSERFTKNKNTCDKRSWSDPSSSFFLMQQFSQFWRESSHLSAWRLSWIQNPVETLATAPPASAHTVCLIQSNHRSAFCFHSDHPNSLLSHFNFFIPLRHDSRAAVREPP